MQSQTSVPGVLRPNAQCFTLPPWARSVPNAPRRQSKIQNPKSKIVRRALAALMVLLVASVPASAQISISGVTPDSAWAIQPPLETTTELTITGSFPFPGFSSVKLVRAAQPDIVALSSLWVDPATVTATFDLLGAAPGLWELHMTHVVLGSAVLPGYRLKAPPPFRRLASWGGPVQAIAVREELIGGQPREIAYVSRGSGFVVLDVTDPAAMVELAQVDLGGTRGMLPTIDLEGDYAYVGAKHVSWAGGEDDGGYGNPDSDGALAIIDIADPLNPFLVIDGLTWRSNASPKRLVVRAGVVYAVFETADVRFRDVSNPAAQESPGTAMFLRLLDPTTGFDLEATELAIQGDHLYAVAKTDVGGTYNWVLQIFDLAADPLNPAFLGQADLYLGATFPSTWRATGLAVEGNWACVVLHGNEATASGLMAVVNVADPAAPSLNGMFGYGADTLVHPLGVTLSGGLAYVADTAWRGSAIGSELQGQGLVIIDVATDPINPALLGSVTTRGGVHGVTVSGTTAYLADTGQGLVAVDVTDPANPAAVGNWYSPASTRSLDKEGDLLFFSDWWNGITTLDVSDPRHPALVSVYQTAVSQDMTGYVGAVRMQDGLAYLAAGKAGLEIVDFATDPANPALLGGFPLADPNASTAFMQGALAVRDNALVVHESRYGSVVFDVADPANPVVAAGGVGDTIGTSAKIRAITEDFMAYGFRDGGPGGIVLDLSDLANPVINATGGIGCGGGCDNGIKSADAAAVVGNRIYTNTAVDSGLWSMGVLDTSVTPSGLPQYWYTAQYPFEPSAGTQSSIDVQNDLIYTTVDSRVPGDAGFSVVHDGLLILDASSLESGQATTDTAVAVATARLAASERHSFLVVDGPYVYLGGMAPFGSDVDESPGLAVYQVAPTGDADGDFDHDLADYAAFQRCFGGAGVPLADGDCVLMDFDLDDDVDLDDFRGFLMAFDTASVFWVSGEPAEFAALVASKGLTQTGFEDFEEADLPPDSEVSFLPPLDEFTDNGVFSPGDITAGLTIQVNSRGGMWPGYEPFDQLVARSAPSGGITSKVVQRSDGDGTDLIFAAANVTAVGFDIVTAYFVDPVHDIRVMVFDTDENLVWRYDMLAGSAAGEFFGVWSQTPIGRINIAPSQSAPTGAADNIQMWAAP